MHRISAGATLVLALVLPLGCHRSSTKTIRLEPKPLAPITVAASVPKPCPDEMALVETEAARLCVDRYEAFVDGHDPATPIEDNESGLVARPAKGKRPQVNISEPAAERACEAAGKRLCTATEWVAACRGRDANVYPYGNEYESGACNEGRPSPVTPSDHRLDAAHLADAPNGSEPGGSFPRCVTSTGIYDMHGNVHEWVSSSPKPDDPRFGEFHGGFYADARANGPGCSYKTVVHLKTYRDYSIGFRCCKDAD